MNIITIDYSMATKSMDIFFTGCDANPLCKGCHNPEAWDFNVGTNWKMWTDRISYNVEHFGGMFSKFFLLGGEPLAQDLTEFTEFLDILDSFGKEIWLFTHYELGEISEDLKQRFDYIKTGRYLPELSSDNHIEYGVRLATDNQHIYKRGVDY